MLYRKIPGGVLAAILGSVALLSAWMAYLRPERLPFYAFTAVFLPAGWALVALIARRRRRSGRPEEESSGWIALGGLIIGVSLAAEVAKSVGGLGETTAQRAVGVAMGVFLVVVGNAMPKILTPLTRQRCDPASVQSLQRFAGWAFVLAGLVYAAAWVVLEPLQAALWSGLVTGACVLVVVVRLALVIARGRGTPPRGPTGAHRPTS